MSSKRQRSTVSTVEPATIRARHTVLHHNSLLSVILSLIDWRECFLLQRVCKAWQIKSNAVLDKVQHLIMCYSYPHEVIPGVLPHNEHANWETLSTMVCRPTVLTVDWRGGYDTQAFERWCDVVNNRRKTPLKRLRFVSQTFNPLYTHFIRNAEEVEFVDCTDVTSICCKQPISVVHSICEKTGSSLCMTCLKPVPIADRYTKCSIHLDERRICNDCVTAAAKNCNGNLSVADEFRVAEVLTPCPIANCRGNYCPFCGFTECVVCEMKQCPQHLVWCECCAAPICKDSDCGRECSTCHQTLCLENKCGRDCARCADVVCDGCMEDDHCGDCYADWRNEEEDREREEEAEAAREEQEEEAAAALEKEEEEEDESEYNLQEQVETDWILNGFF